ncbi:MAG TPA: DUF5808 domain-containing protein [Ktedonobacteraceae bacterium]|nr:DUF5808 domain-containing protein [Ktedonobacteraceae bacterium]
MSLWLFLLLMCVLLIAVVLALFWHPQRFPTKANTFADRRSSDVIFRDDDRYWYAEVFYNNPDDPALFVPKRFGWGWTMNFGHPQARFVLIGMVLIVLVFGILLPVLASGLAPTGCHTFGCSP